MNTADGRVSVIVPVHNEANCLGRLLRSLSAAVEADPLLEGIVVCNGCSDESASIARDFENLTVAEIEVPSKVEALRRGDRLAFGYGRIYLDADIGVSPSGLLSVAEAVRQSKSVGVRPSAMYDYSCSTAPVRWFYRLREEIPMYNSRLWGAGLYALSGTARERFDEFPDVVADDLWVDSLFGHDEIIRLPTVRVVVGVPTTVRGLCRVLCRVYAGNRGLGTSASPSSRKAELFAYGFSSPTRMLLLLNYTILIVLSKIRLTIVGHRRWERDDESRASG